MAAAGWRVMAPVCILPYHSSRYQLGSQEYDMIVLLMMELGRVDISQLCIATSADYAIYGLHLPCNINHFEK
jgi:hypothetical protein